MLGPFYNFNLQWSFEGEKNSYIYVPRWETAYILPCPYNLHCRILSGRECRKVNSLSPFLFMRIINFIINYILIVYGKGNMSITSNQHIVEFNDEIYVGFSSNSVSVSSFRIHQFPACLEWVCMSPHWFWIDSIISNYNIKSSIPNKIQGCNHSICCKT